MEGLKYCRGLNAYQDYDPFRKTNHSIKYLNSTSEGWPGGALKFDCSQSLLRFGGLFQNSMPASLIACCWPVVPPPKLHEGSVSSSCSTWALDVLPFEALFLFHVGYFVEKEGYARIQAGDDFQNFRRATACLSCVYCPALLPWVRGDQRVACMILPAQGKGFEMHLFLRGCGCLACSCLRRGLGRVRS